MTATPQDELIRLAQQGDRDALRQLSERWWPTMRRWAMLQLMDPVLAEDAVQEALIRLIRFIRRYDRGRPFRAWLHTILRNCCRDVAGRRARIGRREVHVDFERGEEHDPARQVDLGKMADVALQAFDRLSPRQRQVFDLCDRQGLTPTEAAQVLDIAPGTSRATLFAARKALRQHMLAHRRDVLELLK